MVRESLVPRSEQFRHIEGYGHVGLPLEIRSQRDHGELQGLVGKAQTFQSRRRTGAKSDLRSYLISIESLARWKKARLLARSLFIGLGRLATPKILTGIHLDLMRYFPRAYFIASSAFSHGILRFIRIIFVDFVKSRFTRRG